MSREKLGFKRKFSSVVFWSIISAAFIGPGTVTTAAKSGSEFGLTLLWALVFSTIATIFLQESAARLTLAANRDLGEIIKEKFHRSRPIILSVFLSIAFGCAAYQTGNILGAVSGLELIFPGNSEIFTLGIGVVAAIFLWRGSFRMVAQSLGILVALMGVAFLIVAFQARPLISDLLSGAFVPKADDSSLLLTIGLIGTTIVPYNLFLASGISRHQTVEEMRWGIGMAVAIGGIISMGILVAGTQLEDNFEFITLANTLEAKSGLWASYLFSFGLGAAGMTSAITAPFAAAVAAKSLFERHGRVQWTNQSTPFRFVWGIILAIGMFFSFLKVQPVPAIILAQAINGILLPVVVYFLVLMINDHQIIPGNMRHGIIINLVLIVIFLITSFLGFNGLGSAGIQITGSGIHSNIVRLVASICALLMSTLLFIRIFRKRARVQQDFDFKL